MNWRAPAALLIMIAPAVDAQWRPSFSGYAVTMPAVLRLSPDLAGSSGADRVQVLAVTRLRLRPALALPWDALLETEGEVAALYQSAGRPILITQDHIDRQIADLRWTLTESSRWTVIHLLDRLVYRQRFPAGDVTVGRQRISWGTGRIWNPTDLFNPINPVNFARVEKDGADAVAARIYLGPLSDIQGVWNPARHASSNYGGRYRSHVGTFDVSLLGGFFDGAPVAGMDLAGDLDPVGIRAELLASGLGSAGTEKFAKAILGADLQLTPELYGLLEYHFNGRGTSDKAAYDIDGLFNGSLLNVARHYVAASASCLIHPLVVITLTGMVNGNDASQYYTSTASYSAGDELTLGGGVQAFIGGQGDEFSYYPPAAYFRLDLYF